MRKAKIEELPIYTLDLETDPFHHGKTPAPFAAGLYWEDGYRDMWGPACVERILNVLSRMPSALVYVHNGGRFDFYFFLERFAQAKLMMIGARIVQAEMRIEGKTFIFRDSYAAIPVPLKAYAKDDIEIWKLEGYACSDLETRGQTTVREVYKEEIRSYLRADCRYLYELVTGFISRFGRRLTIGSAAMEACREMHPTYKLKKKDDAQIRSRFYFGGRVQCFERGILHGNFKVYDVNSMYPYAMKEFRHPIGMPNMMSLRVSRFTVFVHTEGYSRGAFAVRAANGSLLFPIGYGEYFTTVHEYRAALECGMYDEARMHCAYGCDTDEQKNFGQFVDKYSGLKIQAKTDGNKMDEIFWKLILNSAYGKYAQNPEKHTRTRICVPGEVLPRDPSVRKAMVGKPPANPYWRCDHVMETGHTVWSQHAESEAYFNVATASSITGAARSLLLRAIASADRPVYCDTDSLICEGLNGVVIDSKALGAWKLECECDTVCIAGKKFYALYDKGSPWRDEKGKVKMASKGVSVSPEQIREMCEGKVVQTQRDSPTFSLTGRATFISRNVRMT